MTETRILVERSLPEVKNSPIEEADDEFDFPEDYEASEMVEEVPLATELLSVTERYFTPYYKLNVQRPGNDLCIRVHSNRLCMLSLAPSHAIFRTGHEIPQINFRVTESCDRAANKVRGKGKRGAQPLQATSNICSITCSNGDIWWIKACMSGKLVEVNEALLENPQLIHEPPHKGGYLAIALPSIKNHDQNMQLLLSDAQYQVALEERRENGSESDCTGKRAAEEGASPERQEKILKQ